MESALIEIFKPSDLMKISSNFFLNPFELIPTKQKCSNFFKTLDFLCLES